VNPAFNHRLLSVRLHYRLVDGLRYRPRAANYDTISHRAIDPGGDPSADCDTSRTCNAYSVHKPAQAAPTSRKFGLDRRLESGRS